MLDTAEVVKYLNGYVEDIAHIDVSSEENATWVDINLDIDTLMMSEDNYNRYEQACADFGEKFSRRFSQPEDLVSCHYDASGYNYWTEDMKESNYAMISFNLDDITNEEQLDYIGEATYNLWEELTDLYDVEE